MASHTSVEDRLDPVYTYPNSYVKMDDLVSAATLAAQHLSPDGGMGFEESNSYEKDEKDSDVDEQSTNSKPRRKSAGTGGDREPKDKSDNIPCPAGCGRFYSTDASVRNHLRLKHHERRFLKPHRRGPPKRQNSTPNITVNTEEYRRRSMSVGSGPLPDTGDCVPIAPRLRTASTPVVQTRGRPPLGRPLTPPVYGATGPTFHRSPPEYATKGWVEGRPEPRLHASKHGPQPIALAPTHHRRASTTALMVGPHNRNFTIDSMLGPPVPVHPPRSPFDFVEPQIAPNRMHHSMTSPPRSANRNRQVLLLPNTHPRDEGPWGGLSPNSGPRHNPNRSAGGYDDWYPTPSREIDEMDMAAAEYLYGRFPETGIENTGDVWAFGVGRGDSVSDSIRSESWEEALKHDGLIPMRPPNDIPYAHPGERGGGYESVLGLRESSTNWELRHEVGGFGVPHGREQPYMESGLGLSDWALGIEVWAGDGGQNPNHRLVEAGENQPPWQDPRMFSDQSERVEMEAVRYLETAQAVAQWRAHKSGFPGYSSESRGSPRNPIPMDTDQHPRMSGYVGMGEFSRQRDGHTSGNFGGGVGGPDGGAGGLNEKRRPFSRDDIAELVGYLESRGMVENASVDQLLEMLKKITEQHKEEGAMPMC